MLEEEEIKRVEVSDIIDLDYSSQSTLKEIPQKQVPQGVANVQIDLQHDSTEEVEVVKSLYESQNNSTEQDRSLEYNNTDSYSDCSEEYQQKSFRENGYLFKKLDFMKK